MTLGILTPSQTRKILSELGHRPNKRLGQNFLIDGNSIRKSLELAEVKAGDTVVEIGPGLGTLTTALLHAKATVYAIECDSCLVEHLRVSLLPVFPKSFYLLEGDALEHPLAQLPTTPSTLAEGFKIVANLPYAISTPWLESVLALHLPQKMVLMLQRETADRFTAEPGTKNYGAISIFLSAAYEKQTVHKVSRRCFYPIPKVDSVLLAFNRRAKPFCFRSETRRLIRTFFTQRRKQIQTLCQRRGADRPFLEGWLEDLAAAEVSVKARPETIPLSCWQQLDWRLREESDGPNPK